MTDTTGGGLGLVAYYEGQLPEGAAGRYAPEGPRFELPFEFRGEARTLRYQIVATPGEGAGSGVLVQVSCADGEFREGCGCCPDATQAEAVSAVAAASAHAQTTAGPAAALRRLEGEHGTRRGARP